MKKKTLNGTTVTPYSKEDFTEKEWNNAKNVKRDFDASEIPLGSRRDFLESRLEFHKVSFTCLLTLQNHIDKQNQ